MAKHALISSIILLVNTSHALAAPTNSSNSNGFPMWAIAIIVIIVCLILLGILYLVWRHRGRRANDEEESKPEDLSSSRLAGQSTIAAEHPDDIFIKNDTRIAVEESKHEDDFHISLPLPPMTTSLFSDKFELSEEAAELYKKYMYEEQQQQQLQKQPRFATIRDTLRRSMRRGSTTPKKQPVNRLQNLVADPPRPPTPASRENPSSPSTVAEEKVALEEPENAENLTIDEPKKEQPKQHKDDPKQESVPPAPTSPVSAVSAAGQVILDASIRSKRRSVVPTAELVFSVEPTREEKEERPEPRMAQVQEEKKELAPPVELPRNPSVRDIDWWQKETSVCSSASNSSLSSQPRSQAEQAVPEEQPENEPEERMLSSPEQTPPATLRGALSVRQSIERQSILEKNSGQERVSLGSLASRNSSVGIVASIRDSIASRASNASIRGNHLLLRAQQRPTMAAVFAGEDTMEAPVPTASFSSSTVRTMIPADEYNEGRTNAIKKQPVKEQRPQQQQSKPQKEQQQVEKKKYVACTTMRKQQAQQRGSIPWMQRNMAQGKTPAQRERDRYLQSQK